MILFGFILAGLTALYFILINHFKKSYFQKELWIALIYTAGVWGIPVLTTYPDISIIHYGTFALFFVLAWLDMIIIANYEIEPDMQDGYTSFTTWLGLKKSDRFVEAGLLLSFIASMVLLFYCSIVRDMVAVTVMISMIGQLYILNRYKEELRPKENYRKTSELIFILPFLIFYLIFI